MRQIRTTAIAAQARACATSVAAWASSNVRQFVITTLCLLITGSAWAQCGVENTAFQAGENISYELYFNWGILAKKVGTASFRVSSTTYDSKPAYRMELLANTNSLADSFFKMRDTLTSIVSQRLEPLYYRKGAEEESRYTVEEARYSYNGGTASVKQSRYKRGSGTIYSEKTDSRCIFDMVSIMGWARSLNTSNLKAGQRFDFPLASGKQVEEGTLIYKGTKNLDAKDGHTYRTLIYTYITHRDGKDSEIITFYVSDDSNHLPLRLDLSLKFGTARVQFKSVSGNRYPLTSRIK
ncbi:MAG: DUF3108 domain-containing protein [Bacteroidaceae bacterium]|nr:DUF3108 domain-containing protein [Bacteroidaceae bacterium]